MKIILADINKEMCDSWRNEFFAYKDVEIYHGSMFEVNGNMIISPANSFGYMTGGVDYAISKTLGWHVQDKVQRKIKTFYGGELLVGQALIVSTKHDKFPYLVCAPTMRVPSLINGTINAYLATRAALIAILRERLLFEENIVPVFTGMGTGTGNLNKAVCARQMRAAYEDVMDNKAIFPASLGSESLRQRMLEGKLVRD